MPIVTFESTVYYLYTTGMDAKTNIVTYEHTVAHHDSLRAIDTEGCSFVLVEVLEYNPVKNDIIYLRGES